MKSINGLGEINQVPETDFMGIVIQKLSALFTVPLMSLNFI